MSNARLEREHFESISMTTQTCWELQSFLLGISFIYYIFNTLQSRHWKASKIVDGKFGCAKSCTALWLAVQKYSACQVRDFAQHAILSLSKCEILHNMQILSLAEVLHLQILLACAKICSPHFQLCRSYTCKVRESTWKFWSPLTQRPCQCETQTWPNWIKICN